MIEFLKSGGVLIIPIVLCGFFATYIIIERCAYFALVSKKDAAFKKNLFDAVSRKDFSAAEAYCVSCQTPFSQVAKKAIDCRNLSESDMRELVQCEMDEVAPQFEHYLTLLATIANISTLLGLFGTVTGNIKAFGVLGAGSTMGDPAVLASSISEALVTTAAGLFVAIPSLIFNNYLVRRAGKLISAMESSVTNLILKITGRLG